MSDSKIDFDYAYNYCKNIATKHYENFPVGSLLIPKNKRKYVHAVYAFARYADDIADSEFYSSEDKTKKLNHLQDELNKCVNGDLDKLSSDTKQIFIALSNTIGKLKIPVDEFKNLLTAFKQDSVRQRYDTFEELLTYSKYSANPIGHLVLYIFGYDIIKDKKIFECSDKICTALQLTNFWQDVSRDLKINRIYLPAKVMSDYSYNGNMLFEKNENDNFKKMIKYLVTETEKLFEEGKDIVNYLNGRLKFEIKATICGGREILKKIVSDDYKVLSSRPALNNFDKLKILCSILK